MQPTSRKSSARADAGRHVSEHRPRVRLRRPARNASDPKLLAPRCCGADCGGSRARDQARARDDDTPKKNYADLTLARLLFPQPVQWIACKDA